MQGEKVLQVLNLVLFINLSVVEFFMGWRDICFHFIYYKWNQKKNLYCNCFMHALITLETFCLWIGLSTCLCCPFVPVVLRVLVVLVVQQRNGDKFKCNKFVFAFCLPFAS